MVFSLKRFQLALCGILISLPSQVLAVSIFENIEVELAQKLGVKLEEQDQQFCQNSDNPILCITTLIYAKARLNDDLDRFKNRIRAASLISDSQIPNIVTSCQKGLQKLAQTTFTPQFSQNYQNYRYFQGTALALLGQFSHQGSNGMTEQKRYICFYINGTQGLTIPIIEE